MPKDWQSRKLWVCLFTVACTTALAFTEHMDANVALVFAAVVGIYTVGQSLIDHKEATHNGDN